MINLIIIGIYLWIGAYHSTEQCLLMYTKKKIYEYTTIRKILFLSVLLFLGLFSTLFWIVIVIVVQYKKNYYN